MVKNIKRFFVIIVISIVLSTINIIPGEFFVSTIFTVIGIVFSVGLGLIVTFNISGIKNKDFLLEIRKTINTVRNSFIFYFILSIVAYLTIKFLIDAKLEQTSFEFGKSSIIFHWTFGLCIIMLISLYYFIANFFSIQRLNNQIHDELLRLEDQNK